MIIDSENNIQSNVSVHFIFSQPTVSPFIYMLSETPFYNWNRDWSETVWPTKPCIFTWALVMKSLPTPGLSVQLNKLH